MQLKKLSYSGPPSVHNGLLKKQKAVARSVVREAPVSRDSIGMGAGAGSKEGSKEEKQCLTETIHENQRRGYFKRVFPSIDFLYYKQFFEEHRNLNYFIDSKIYSKRRLDNASSKM
jgi:hypothetical protein